MQGHQTFQDYIKITGISREQYLQLEKYLLESDQVDASLLDIREGIIRNGRFGDIIGTTRALVTSETDYIGETAQFVEVIDPEPESYLILHLATYGDLAPEEYVDQEMLQYLPEVPEIARKIASIIRETYPEDQLRKILQKYGL